ncbi:hypothetical protein [Actinoplanes teichomyceticus]|uniref:Uncharacterized protein n=1 Tax=Actinoplanes teichomyceticus TaxID=1867 RepID=A0A561VLD9_ACTTI|nr:hypothetical protein [Actinoplanes teichomyceticus]TWG12431.1 hypothetical protein FHX34_105298 [Actinoplanes teichomyceticus]GIF13792.1 hypothetical protein Ate01nite_38240 [Actinoplanes teichomyceticus]
MTASPPGREIDRIDDRLKATGAATYSADHQAENTAYACVVTSAIGL